MWIATVDTNSFNQEMVYFLMKNHCDINEKILRREQRGLALNILTLHIFQELMHKGRNHDRFEAIIEIDECVGRKFPNDK